VEQAAIDRLISKHLDRYPNDKRYVDYLLKNEEFSTEDRSYESWLRYNLHGIDSGNSLIQRLEEKIGTLKGLRVLDIGAGGGGNAIAFARHGCRVVALEIDDLRKSWLKARVEDYALPIAIIEGSIESGELGGPFDLVICNAVLEHVENWKSFMLHLLDLCHGNIYLCWPNRYSILEILFDQHYGLFGAVFLTGRLRWLQKYYIRLFGIKRHAWVTAVPSLRAVHKHVSKNKDGAIFEPMLPMEMSKINNPASINHPVARNVLKFLKHMGLSTRQLTALVAMQRTNHEVLITLKSGVSPG
jgi:SAM-dependent methyltransferase